MIPREVARKKLFLPESVNTRFGVTKISTFKRWWRSALHKLLHKAKTVQIDHYGGSLMDPSPLVTPRPNIGNIYQVWLNFRQNHGNLQFTYWAWHPFETKLIQLLLLHISQSGRASPAATASQPILESAINERPYPQLQPKIARNVWKKSRGIHQIFSGRKFFSYSCCSNSWALQRIGWARKRLRESHSGWPSPQNTYITVRNFRAVFFFCKFHLYAAQKKRIHWIDSTPYSVPQR